MLDVAEVLDKPLILQKGPDEFSKKFSWIDMQILERNAKTKATQHNCFIDYVHVNSLRNIFTYIYTFTSEVFFCLYMTFN